LRVKKYRPLEELFRARTLEFLREPEAVFWVYVFPLLLMVGLGIAFRSGGNGPVRVAVVVGARSEGIREALATRGGFEPEVLDRETALAYHARGIVDIVVVPLEGAGCEYIYDPQRQGTDAARLLVDGVIQESAGRTDPVPTRVVTSTEPGGRYIDWLIPGLMGMNVMGSGLWGLGFVTVDLRMRKLLKRFAATPMRRSDFLLALAGSRLVLLLTEMAVILALGRFLFDVPIRGSLLAIGVVTLLGAMCFSGLGLLVGSRADKIETVSGLLNVVMLPMWILSGIFFAAERFPASMQPFVQALPLTQLNNALRAVILDGMPLHTQGLAILTLALFASVSFTMALRWFRWN
jgi:ABC-type multidrug transport system permease subunit